ncbi:hypothetical protein Cni_G28521 [Canna indica]|uniref:Uncharacterized protein n=1 Tax=Canna indica TaxID=4628 RepID=A0AAQ3L3L6_9LILI|nr:hypothetical protein Cni_G28521 [Canna indica]
MLHPAVLHMFEASCRVKLKFLCGSISKLYVANKLCGKYTSMTPNPRSIVSHKSHLIHVAINSIFKCRLQRHRAMNLIVNFLCNYRLASESNYCNGIPFLGGELIHYTMELASIMEWHASDLVSICSQVWLGN